MTIVSAVLMAGMGWPLGAHVVEPASEKSKAPETAGTMPSAATQANSVDHDALRRLYGEAIMRRITESWVRPASVSADDVCPIRVLQKPGGLVMAAEVLPECPYDEAGRRSAERAILVAQPLPYVGFESVFSRTLVLRFRAAD
jgi:colicin import membrane protein